MKTLSRLRFLVPSLALPVVAILLIASVHTKVVKANGFPWLACGTDDFAFNQTAESVVVVQTNGPTTVGAMETYPIDFPVNGMTPAFGFIVSGQPEDVGDAPGNTLRKLGDHAPPHVLLTVPASGNSFSESCCNEQMVQAPDGKFYHAHYGDVIQQLVVQSGQSVVVTTFSQPDVVGMASDGVSIWITNWDGRQVGKWDPGTNVFTPIFSTPNNAGGLAWDVANGVLWVGMTGGTVIPYDATGQQLGPGFQPFGSISNTIDGLAFVPQ